MKDENKKVEETKIISVNDKKEYQKSNFIISSVYKSTLLENRVLAVALNSMDKAIEDKEGSLIVELKVDELRNKFGVKGNSLYDNLDKASRKLVGGRTIGFSDPEHNRFEYVPLLTKASFEDGVFTLRFAPEMKKYLKDLNLTGSFTRLNIETMLSFESVYALRLYEILKSKAYAPKGEYVTDNTKFLIEIPLSELKLELGVVNGELAKIKSVLLASGKNGTPDYDLAIEKAEEQMYSVYSEFRRVCIDPAIKEINKKTEMFVEYKAKRTGRGGKTTAIDFTVSYHKSPFEKEDIKDNNDVLEKADFNEDDFIDAIRDTISHNLKTSEARTIAKVAEFNMDIIVKADNYICSLKKPPKDYAAYMVSTIQKKYYEKTVDTSKRGNNKIIDVEPEEITHINETLSKDDIIRKMTE